MITIFIFIVYVAICFLMYLMNMFYPSELIPTAMFVLCLYCYRRNNKSLIQGFLFIQSVMLFIRFIVATIIGVTIPSVPKPLTLDSLIIKQFSGLITIFGWILWLFCITAYMYALTKKETEKCNSIDEIVHNKAIIHITNLYTVSSTTAIIFMIVASYVYSLTDYYKNMLVFILSIVLLSIGTHMMEIAVIRKRKEAIIMAAKSEIVVMDLNNDDDDDDADADDGADGK